MTKWISVKDRLPKDNVVVIGGSQIIKWVDSNMKFSDGEWMCWDYDKEEYEIAYYPPTHWMPLPEPPKSEG